MQQVPTIFLEINQLSQHIVKEMNSGRRRKCFDKHTYFIHPGNFLGVTVMQMDWVSNTSLLATPIKLKWYLKYCIGDGRQVLAMV